jgi:hypothetical protein
MRPLAAQDASHASLFVAGRDAGVLAVLAFALGAAQLGLAVATLHAMLSPLRHFDEAKRPRSVSASFAVAAVHAVLLVAAWAAYAAPVRASMASGTLVNFPEYNWEQKYYSPVFREGFYLMVAASVVQLVAAGLTGAVALRGWDRGRTPRSSVAFSMQQHESGAGHYYDAALDDATVSVGGLKTKFLSPTTAATAAARDGVYVQLPPASPGGGGMYGSPGPRPLRM